MAEKLKFNIFKTELQDCAKHGTVLHTNIFGKWHCNYCLHETSVKQRQMNDLYEQKSLFLRMLRCANLADSMPVNSWEVYSYEPRQEVILGQMRQWLIQAISCKKPFNLILQGTTGTGKTYCAKSLARSFIGVGSRSHFCKSSELTNKHKERFTGDFKCYKQYLETLCHLDLLVLDDLGNGDSDIGVVLDVLTIRYDLNKPTIITTNLNDEALNLLLSERVYERVKERCLTLLFDWVSYRKINADYNHGLGLFEGNNHALSAHA